MLSVSLEETQLQLLSYSDDHFLVRLILEEENIKLVTANQILLAACFPEHSQTWCYRHIQVYTPRCQLSSLNGTHVRSKGFESQSEVPSSMETFKSNPDTLLAGWRQLFFFIFIFIFSKQHGFWNLELKAIATNFGA